MAGKDLSRLPLGTTALEREEAFDFFLLRAIRASWQSMQKMPCEVRA